MGDSQSGGFHEGKPDSQNPSHHYHLGLAYQKINDPARAKAHLERALKVSPNVELANEIRKALAGLGGDQSSGSFVRAKGVGLAVWAFPRAHRRGAG